MRQALTFLIGMLLGACTSNQTAAIAPSQTSEFSRVTNASEIRGKTVALVVDIDGAPLPYCTGVWVSHDAILTALHCVSSHIRSDLAYASHGDVYAADGSPRGLIVPRRAYVVDIDAAHDLALLRAMSAPSHDVARVAIEPVAQGAFSSTIGHSRGLWWSYSSGDVAAVRTLRDGDDDLDPAMTWVQTTAHISEGNSGGGLFDAHAQLIGIAHAYVNQGQSLNLFVHKRHIETFLLRQGSSL